MTRTGIARFDVRALMTMTTRRLANIGLLSSNRYAIVRRKVEVGLLVVELIGHRRSRVRVGDVVTTVVITAVAGPLVVRGDDIAVVLVLRLPDSTVVASELELVVLRLLDLNWLFGVVAHAVSTDVEELSNRHRDDGESRVDLRLSPASVIVATENGHLLLIFQSIGELRFANEYRRQENLVVGIDWLVVLRGKVVRPELKKLRAWKEKADGKDQSWVDCVATEKAYRVEVEKADESLKRAEAAVDEPCKSQEDNKMFAKNPNPDEYKVSIDFSVAGNKDSELKTNREKIDGLLSSVKTGAQQATARWTQAKNACDHAHAEVEKAQHDLHQAQEIWSNQRKRCMEMHESRQVSLCLFGVNLQRKCGKVAAFNQVIYEVNLENGGTHSHPDRLKEWEGTSVTKCMMQKVIQGYSIDSAALEACYQAVNFDLEVGTLDRKESQFVDLTSAPKFTCSEETITFTGEIWNVPAGEAPASSEYTKEPFHPEVNLKQDSP